MRYSRFTFVLLLCASFLARSFLKIDLFWPITILMGGAAVVIMVLWIWSKVFERKEAKVLHAIQEIEKSIKEGSWAQAESQSKDAVETARRLFGQQHPNVGVMESYLAGSQYKFGKLKEADASMKRAYSIFSVSLGASHPLVIGLLDQWAFLKESLGEDEQAANLYFKAVTLRESRDAKDPWLAVSYNHLAKLFMDRGRNAESLEVLNKAMAVWSQWNPEGRGREIPAEVYVDLLRHKAKISEESQVDALASVAEALSFKKPDFRLSRAITRLLRGQANFGLLKLKEAEEDMKKGIEGLIQVLGRSAELTDFYIRLSQIYAQGAQFKEAIAALNQADQIERSQAHQDMALLTLIQDATEAYTAGQAHIRAKGVWGKAATNLYSSN